MVISFENNVHAIVHKNFLQVQLTIPECVVYIPMIISPLF